MLFVCRLSHLTEVDQILLQKQWENQNGANGLWYSKYAGDFPFQKIHPGRLTWNLQPSPIWKGKWSEPNLHDYGPAVNLPGCWFIGLGWFFKTITPVISEPGIGDAGCGFGMRRCRRFTAFVETLDPGFPRGRGEKRGACVLRFNFEVEIALHSQIWRRIHIWLIYHLRIYTIWYMHHISI